MAGPRLNRLSIVLDEFNLDQIELAEILDMNKDTVSRWCRNANQPKLSDLYRIAKIFRIDITRLVEPTDWKNETGMSTIEIYFQTKNANKSNTKASSKKGLHLRKK